MKTSCIYCETYHHVGISDGFHLVHIVTLDDGIEQGVQIVEEVDHLIAGKKNNAHKIVKSKSSYKFLKKNYLERSTLGRHFGEANNVTEIDGDSFVGFRFDAPSSCESLSHGSECQCQPLRAYSLKGVSIHFARVANNKIKKGVEKRD